MYSGPKVIITGDGVNVEAFLVSDLSPSVAANWDTITPGMENLTARLHGMKSALKYFTGDNIATRNFPGGNKWAGLILSQGSSHIELTLTLKFVVINDPVEDVVKPVKDLKKAAVPPEIGEKGFLGFAKPINVFIEDYMRLDEVALISVDPTFSKERAVGSGGGGRRAPVSADVAITVKTRLPATKDLIDQIYPGA